MIKKQLFFFCHCFVLLLCFISAKSQTSLIQKRQPDVVPMPREIQAKPGQFDLTRCKVIVVGTKSLYKAALNLQQYLKSIGVNVQVKAHKYASGTGTILLSLGETREGHNSKEAYQLSVTPQKITIKAPESVGVYYGLQTLKQLVTEKKQIAACELTDWPAFAWRGYMIDAGRNFMPISMLKEQIDVMARYKLNIFHFHITEDIAWRLESKLYPQLTDPGTMLRNKGSFYTEADLKELIQYCKERYITLVPEIDMPGHSAAFTRAMKMDMQSDSGLAIVKNILREFCSTYDVPYLHIGADEVKITNRDFLPEVTRLIESLGKKVIGWEPGGNFSESTIRQLWMEGATKVSDNKNIRYIDSRHLYLNHMDPLESVVTIFNRQICNLDQGDSAALGGIICAWPDRRVDKPEDILLQNPIYPGMLAFAERSWRGGGTKGWIANIGAPKTYEAESFAAFEKRLMVHKDRYFVGMSFPYVKQTGLQWKFYGPFNNEAELTKSFPPQNKDFNIAHEPASLTAIGGTIILRHWWAPQVKGLLDNPQENTTWYAATRIWSDDDKVQDFWIGFNNISRSYASDSPLAGSWDNRGSQVFVNDQVIPPPAWKQAGARGDMELPLKDEGYEYREPVKIKLYRGWNKVLIKLPIASFKGKDWKNPQKWMFTFVQAGI